MVYVVTREKIGRQTEQNGVRLLKVCLVVEPDLTLDILLCPLKKTEEKWSDQSQTEVAECRRESETTSQLCKHDQLAWRKQAWCGNNLFETELVLDRVK